MREHLPPVYQGKSMASPFSVLSPHEDIVGLDLGDGVAVASQVRIDRQKRLRLDAVAWTSYNPKAPAEDIAAAIRLMWKKFKLSRFSVITCLRSRALTLKHFQYPFLSDAELESALQLEAEESLQMSPEAIVLDWHVNQIPGKEAPEESTISGTLVAVPKSDVDDHIALLSRSALFPVSTNVSCFALSNLYKACMSTEGSEYVVCIAHLGQRSADIIVLSSDGSVYPRTVYVHAGQSKDPVKYFTESIKDVLTYCRFKLHLPDVDTICLTGVADEATRDMMNAAIDVPVELWDPLSHIHGMSRRISRQLAEADLHVKAGIAVSMGLALGRA
jgi:hypothetical protein